MASHRSSSNYAPPTPRARNLQPRSGSRHRAVCERITAALPRRALEMRPRDPRARGNNRTRNDDPNHDRLGRRSIRGDASHAPPQPHRDPTLLQHERLYQLPRRRSDDRDRDLPDLRLHPTPSLSIALAPLAGVRADATAPWPSPGPPPIDGVHTTATGALSRDTPCRGTASRSIDSQDGGWS